MSNTKAKEKVSKELVKKLAELVKVELTEQNAEELQESLGATIDYVKNLDEVDTSKFEPTYHTVDQKNVTFDDGTEGNRTFTQEEATSNGKKVVDGYFVVDKILDK
jgi:aspartyl-tRNA(Asn)/glutamyl-tRNA(Gln) amidotransferase subunit C